MSGVVENPKHTEHRQVGGRGCQGYHGAEQDSRCSDHLGEIDPRGDETLETLLLDWTLQNISGWTKIFSSTD